jgi:hypothetical protein
LNFTLDAPASRLARRQIRVNFERNEPEDRLFILRCNTSWMILDFVHALSSA